MKNDTSFVKNCHVLKLYTNCIQLVYTNCIHLTYDYVLVYTYAHEKIKRAIRAYPRTTEEKNNEAEMEKKTNIGAGEC